MVGVTKIGRGNADYWIEAVAEGGEDYYTKPGEAPGEWLGALAEELGLAGEVDRDAYAAVLAGEDPLSGEALVAPPASRASSPTRDGRERRVGADPRLRRALRRAEVGLAALRGRLARGPRRRPARPRGRGRRGRSPTSSARPASCSAGAGGKRIEPGAGFVAMAFRHRSSRAGDPALHTHVVTANMTRAASDGRWLSPRRAEGPLALLAQAKAAGHVYQAALRAEITRELGVEWQAVHNGYADLAGDRRGR